MAGLIFDNLQTALGLESYCAFLTQKERDIESGLDYFLARYYSSAQGRFTSPDEFTGGPDELYDFATDASDNPTFYADLHEPQSLNKYQYCYNNPLAYVDPNGHQIRKKLEEAADTYVALQKGRIEGATSVVTGTLKFAWHAITSPSAALEDIKQGVESAKETLKTDLEVVKHPIEAAKAINDAVNENPQQAARILGNAEGQVLASVAIAKGVKAIGEAASSTKVVKLPGANDVVGQRMIVNTQTGRAFQLHKPHHGKGLHLQEMKVVPHPKKPGAFRITDRNVRSTTIIPMKDRP